MNIKLAIVIRKKSSKNEKKPESKKKDVCSSKFFIYGEYLEVVAKKLTKKWHIFIKKIISQQFFLRHSLIMAPLKSDNVISWASHYY